MPNTRRDFLLGVACGSFWYQTAQAQYTPYPVVMYAPTLFPGERGTQWLLLLIDSSGSMVTKFAGGHSQFGNPEASFYALQIEATARALLEPCVVERLQGEPDNRWVVGVIAWSGPGQQAILVPWTVVRSLEDIVGITEKVRRAPRHFQDTTGVAAALQFALDQYATSVTAGATKRVIDIFANGLDNIHVDRAIGAQNVKEASQRAETMRVTINAIVAEGNNTGETPEEMEAYFQRYAVTRDGLVFRVDSEGDVLERLSTANATKLCADIS